MERLVSSDAFRRHVTGEEAADAGMTTLETRLDITAGRIADTIGIDLMARSTEPDHVEVNVATALTCRSPSVLEGVVEAAVTPPRTRADHVSAADAARQLRSLPEGAREIVSPLIADAIAETRALGTPRGLRRFLLRVARADAATRERMLRGLAPEVRTVVEELAGEPGSPTPEVRAMRRGARTPEEVNLGAEAINDILGRPNRPTYGDATVEMEGTLPAYMIEAIQRGRQGGEGAPAELLITVDGEVIGRPASPPRPGGRPNIRAAPGEGRGLSGARRRTRDAEQEPAETPEETTTDTTPAEPPVPGRPEGLLARRARRWDDLGRRIGYNRALYGDRRDARAERQRPEGRMAE
ncbi:TPA: hypothetical protein EYP38_00305, partial [Candidatus Micrarchaeota archaeon]|nr:hypothetical protein [Candidatus Micrarchaeota archaeon]